MLKTLSFVVVFESFINPKIKLGPWVWDMAQNSASRGSGKGHYRPENLGLGPMARISTFLRDPKSHLDEIQSMYYALREECMKMEAILSQTPMTRSKEGILVACLPPPARRIHVRQQTSHGILLMITLAFKAILCAYEPPGVDCAAMGLEADILVQHVITLAEQAMQYRPLAASATPLCLMVAWAVTEDMLTRLRLERLLEEYQTDFPSARWQDQAQKVKAALSKAH